MPSTMIPAGYMAKYVARKPEWLQAPAVQDIYSVSNCVSQAFADYINFWKHNGYWLFDSPDIIRAVAREQSVLLEGTSLFYYEAYEEEFDDATWHPYAPEPSFQTNVAVPASRRLEGLDVVTFLARNSPECSPLSCNGLAGELHTNAHCLLPSFEDAQASVASGRFNNSEPGPYRIFAVYSVEWS